MAYTNLAPRTQNITGADLTGVDGTANRTYAIPDVGVLSSGIDIIIQGTPVHEGANLDFTLSGETITFLNIIDDTDVIRINYFITITSVSTSSLVTSSDLRYATTLQFAEILGARMDVPSWEIGTDPTNEAVGTGDDSNSVFYLDQKNIIADSYILYANNVAMIETTHYVLDLLTGKITLTAAGITLLSTNNLTASYSYLNNGMNNDFLVSVLQRAEQEVDDSVNGTFLDTSVENPEYCVSDETYATKGYFEQQYFSKERPIVDVSCDLSADITDSDVTISLDTGCGILFPLTGNVLIGTEIVSYTGITDDDLTGCTRGALNSTASAHIIGDTIHTSIMQVSGTAQGSVPTWNTLQYNSDFVIDDRKFFIYDNVIQGVGVTSNNLLSTPDVENRVRLIHLFGFDSIPTTITRLTLLYGKRQLITDNVGKSMIAGRNEFKPEMLNADLNEIDRIVNANIQLPMGNT